ncbi:ornithine cyclodeaminase [Arthrobacter sp. GAS37]|uniref:ornithine cyclodeaminase family protein n=1 Tax=Arthrobacter sp. GAS37 TaxID=3156261 RepID=UPI003836C197
MVKTLMRFISEERSSSLISHSLAFDAAREALIAASQPASASFPTVIGHGSAASDRFTVKSGATSDLAGIKIGSYWPGNGQKNLPRHSSLILLFDQEIGRIGAVIEGGGVNAYRTAAADAVAADALARPDASSLTVFGTGHQAIYECAAVSRVRPIDTISIVGRTPERVQSFIGALSEHGLTAQPAIAQRACEDADIIITATTARAPLFEASWVQPGTHIATMGSDAQGKQELPPELFSRGSLFCDLPEQSRVIGEFQHLPDQHAATTAIGSVLTGDSAGRTNKDQITIFDSSGIALQDLYIAIALLQEESSQ